MLSTLLPNGMERTWMALGGAIGGVFSFAFGDMGVLLCWLIAFVVVDYLTGTIGALKTGTWQSKVCGLGIVKKVLYFSIVALAHGLDQVFAPLIHIEVMQSITICAYCAGEFGSIIENFERMGLADVVPPVLRRAIKALNGRLETEAEKLAPKEFEELK